MNDFLKGNAVWIRDSTKQGRGFYDITEIQIIF